MLYLVIALSILVILVLGIVIVAALKPSGFVIARSQSVNASPEVLFPLINDLQQFQRWNPFKDKDPDAENIFSGADSGVGAKFHWRGNANVGEGIMSIVESNPVSHVDIQLQFIKPFPGINQVRFSLEPKQSETIVTWRMSGTYALFPKIVCMFVNMDKMIGNDFERGLTQLKSIAETTGAN